MNTDSNITVYGSKISYFTGKLEGYLRYKELPYRFQAMTEKYFNTIVPEKTGAQQMPAVELADGRWATDTTPLIRWFEQEYPQHAIIPSDPVQAYLCDLIEDYADEWLWRPAMHYRWSYYGDRQLLGTVIVDELFSEMKAPTPIKRWAIRRRQKSNFVDKDGVSATTWDHVERGYLRVLRLLETIFQDRPYVFGGRPTGADFGLFGPMFRHFSQDPTPQHIMREAAPAVFEWVGRMWNARGSRTNGEWVEGIPSDILPLLTEIGETHLKNMVANAGSWRAGNRQYDVAIQEAQYLDLPVSQYRSWCLEQLQQRFQSLPVDAQSELRPVLENQACWEPLWEIREPRSDYDPQRQAPFGVGLKVYPVEGV